LQPSSPLFPYTTLFRFRAMVLFQGSPFIATIEELVGRIDAEILPMIGGGNHAAVNELQQKIEEIKYLLNDLFQSAASIENGRDPDRKSTRLNSSHVKNS